MENLEYTDELYTMPVIPLRGVVVFPEMVLHFDIGRKKSIAALKHAMSSNQRVFLVAQRDPAVDDPNIDDLYSVGVVCTVKQLIRIPNSDNLRVIVEGCERASLITFTQTKPFIMGAVDTLITDDLVETDEAKAYIRAIKKEFETYASLIPKISNDIKVTVISINEGGRLCDFICANSFIDYEEKQDILESVHILDRLANLFVLLKKENAALEIETEIQQKVQEAIDKNQREYYLREELKVISESLGDGENPAQEADEYKKKINLLKCSDEIKEKLNKECNKLSKMPGGSHEATVIRSYLDKCIEIPFGKYTKNSINLKKSRTILDKEHYSLSCCFQKKS